MRVHHREPELENHDRGLDWDLPRLLQRRGLLKLVAGAGLAGAGLVTLGACADDARPPAPRRRPARTGHPSGAPSGGPGGGPPGGGAPPESTQTSDTANGELPEETAGPYPGDGSNGANVLTESGVVRSDITSSFGSSTTKAEGVPLRDHHDHQRLRERQAAAGRRRGLHLALRPGRAVLPLLPGGHQRELPARGAGDRRQGQVTLHQHLPGLLLRAAGRTSTSRSTPAWPRRPTAATRSPRPRWR